jgi:hypothetical protein
MIEDQLSAKGLAGTPKPTNDESQQLAKATRQERYQQLANWCIDLFIASRRDGPQTVELQPTAA